MNPYDPPRADCTHAHEKSQPTNELAFWSINALVLLALGVLVSLLIYWLA
jgi:hypothetical protein